jgi:hypothetical protein
MNTGISILNAKYGTSSSNVDVTKTVSSFISNGVLSIPSVSASALNITDPSPGQPKTLTVSYTINSGTKQTEQIKDNDSFLLNAPPQTKSDGLQIIKAEYGYAGNMQDVTDAIQNYVSNGNINITVGFKTVGLPDPNPAKKKYLEVEYTINGSKNTKKIDDGSPLKISAPPVTAPSNTTPSQNVGGLMGILFKNIAYFFGIFLHSFSVFVAIDFGNQFVSPMLWGGLALFIPFFSFWALPQLAFLVRLFKTEDFIVAKV